MNRFGLFAALLGLSLVPAAGCYDPGDLGDAPFKCTNDFPECPDGYTCDGTRCRKNSGGTTTMPLNITKQMTVPPTMDPGLDANNCPDKDLEPNNDLMHATPIFSNARLDNLAVCTAGDVDYFHATASSQYARIIVEYSARSGDLDVARIDSAGNLLETDGSARDNACIVSATPLTGDVWIGVVGANNKDRNRYRILLELTTTRPTCATGPVDGGTGG